MTADHPKPRELRKGTDERLRAPDGGLTKTEILEMAHHIAVGMPVVTVSEFEEAMTKYEQGELR